MPCHHPAKSPQLSTSVLGPLVGISLRAGCRVWRVGGRAGRWNMNSSGSRKGHPSAFGASVRWCFAAKQGVCWYLSEFPCRCRKLPEYAQCPNAPRLGTLGGMIHDTRNIRQARRARTLPISKDRARACPSLLNTGQSCPARCLAVPLRGRMRAPVTQAVRHNGSPWYAEQRGVDSTPSAACPIPSVDAFGWRRPTWQRGRIVRRAAGGSASPMQGTHAERNRQRGQAGSQP
jgi:hypothetical protein